LRPIKTNTSKYEEFSGSGQKSHVADEKIDIILL